MLKAHERSGQHTIVVDELKSRTLEELSNDDYQLETNHYHDGAYETTMKVIRLVYAEVKLGKFENYMNDLHSLFIFTAFYQLI